METAIADMSSSEIDQVSGGAIFLVPLAIAFGKGALAGATAAGLGLAILDAFDVIDAF